MYCVHPSIVWFCDCGLISLRCLLCFIVVALIVTLVGRLVVMMLLVVG